MKSTIKKIFLHIVVIILLCSSLMITVVAESSAGTRMVFVGDNLIHKTLAEAGENFGYDSFYENISSMINSADISVVNQETVFADSYKESTDYPLFSTPKEVGHSLAKAGFDIVSYANNHAMDKGISGLNSTLSFWEQYPDIKIIGARKSSEEQQGIIIQRDGIKFGFLAYTDLTNKPLPYDKPWATDMLTQDSLVQISKFRETCDFLTVMVHWGQEYESSPSTAQRQSASQIAGSGADLIIGSHPHVLQPVEWIETSKGETLVYYSLGNFLSHQNTPETLVGGMADVTVSNIGGKVKITNAKIVPIVTHYDNKQGVLAASVYPLSNYTSQLAKRHGVNYKKGADTPFTLNWIYLYCEGILGEWFVADT